MRHIKTYQVFEASETAPAALTQEQIDWLDKCVAGSWKINRQTGLVDVVGDFYCSGQGLEDLKGVKFGKVSREFNCEYNQLTTLEGAPQKVGYSFNCNNNRLTSLVGAPLEVGISFSCQNNQLTSLEGAPQKARDFNCMRNQLTSMEGAPQKVGRYFYCGYNNITSLEGAPQKVGWCFYLEENPVSYETLSNIFRRMQGGKSYLQAVESLWSEIPIDDQALLYRPEFEWANPTAFSPSALKAFKAYQRIKGML